LTRRKQFFFEKKNQKTFTRLVDADGTIGTHPQRQKFFGSFFQKRTASFSTVGPGRLKLTGTARQLFGGIVSGA